MLTLTDFSFLLVTPGKDLERLLGVYNSIRTFYPENEIVIVYENQSGIQLNTKDTNLIEIYTNKRVYVGEGYNIALKESTKKGFVFFHDDTFVSENFLENMIPHISESQLCNFTLVDHPIQNVRHSQYRPVSDFGRHIQDFDFKSFCKFCKEHIEKLQETVIDSPFGGFFMCGYKSAVENVGGFDESIRPYFYEDSDLILRLRLAGYKFVRALNSLAYHMGSLTSRGTEESRPAEETTARLFIKKWKAPWEIIREYTLANEVPYKKINFEVKAENCERGLKEYIDLVNEPGSDIVISFDGNKFTQNDFNRLRILVYILQSIQEPGLYELDNIKITKK